ncbi:19412_t:CDS:2 [Racocetra fulgida]|uniref:19412_t:CDS:1 n=1 Tax=Racocetra fulgida TaxID=60492 RepID=A0A9N8ZHV5_9GLOM|nr:19412_t:CDS:2 [Racocetra fulgida]
MKEWLYNKDKKLYKEVKNQYHKCFINNFIIYLSCPLMAFSRLLR